MPTAHDALSGPVVPSKEPRSRTLIRAAYAVNLAYVLWFWVTFAAGYWVYSLFGLDPSVDSLKSAGGLGWIALVMWALAASVPSWFGARFAVRAVRAGGRGSATVALILNVVFVVAFLVWIIVAG